MDGSLAVRDRRAAPREGVLRRARLLVGDAVHDCIMLDSSEGGARVRLGTLVSLPAKVELHMAGGARRTASPRWSRGMDVGLSFDAETGTLGAAESDLAWAAYEQLRDGRLDPAMRLLRDATFFGDDSLRRAATEAEAARDRLEAMLRARARQAHA